MRILIAGFGSAGRRHFRNLTALGHDVCFYRVSRSTLPTDEIAGCRVFDDLNAALQTHPAAVIVANPTALHVPVATAAARAGLDVFIEKPLSDSLAGCDELASLAASRALVTMIGCQYRFHPLLITLREQLLARAFGAPMSAHAEYGEDLRHWHPWEDHRQSYSARAALGGGAILTLIHPLDYLHWLFGDICSVHASTAKAPWLETNVVDDVADVTLEFTSGVIAHAHVDFVQSPPVHALTVVCERGRAVLDFLDGTLRWQTAPDSVQVIAVPGDFDRNAMFVAEMEHFLACVQARRQTDVPIADGRAVLEIALKAREDARERRQASGERCSST